MTFWQPKHLRFYLFVFLSCMTLRAFAQQGGPTADELKDLLQSPAALFVLMLMASFGSMLNQVIKAKKDGASITFAQYLANWPELVFALINNVLGFITLIVTDQLNFGSAIGIGFVANSLADSYRKGGRSAEIADSTPVQPPKE